MSIRKATHKDLPAITEVLSTAFHDEEVVGVLLHPYRHAFPNDQKRYWTQLVREWYWDFRHMLVVGVVVNEDGRGKREEVVAGVADWVRHGDDRAWRDVWGVKFGGWDPRLLITKFIALYHRLYNTIFPIRSLSKNPPIRDINTYLGKLIDRHFVHIQQGDTSNTTINHSDAWHLGYLAVSPAYQRSTHHFGTALAMWGIRRARIDGICAGVVPGNKRPPMYKRIGFTNQVGNLLDERVSENEPNPLEEYRNNLGDWGQVLFTDVPSSPEINK